MKWVRAKDGILFGVCKGLAKSLDIPVGAFRLIWILSILFLGAGFWLYMILALSLPREDKIKEASEPWILGVCSKIAQRSDMEVGIARFLAIVLALFSGGATIVGYIILYFVLEDKKTQSSDNNPVIPPSAT